MTTIKKTLSLLIIILSTSLLLSKAQDKNKPEEVLQFITLGDSLSKLHKDSLAISAYEDALHLERESEQPREKILTSLLSKIALHNYYLREYEKALSYLDEVLQIDSNLVFGYDLSGHIYTLLENNKAAIKNYKKVIELKPLENANAYGGLGWLLILEDNYKDAFYYCKTAYKLDTTAMPSAVNLGHAYFLNNKIDSAKIYYRKSLQLIKSIEEYEEGPLKDFNILSKKKIDTTTLKEIQQWYLGEFENNYRFYIQADEHFKKASEYYKEKKLSETSNYLIKSKNEELKAGTLRKKYLEDIAFYLIEIANTFSVQGDINTAINNTEEALGIYSKLGIENKIALSVNNLGYFFSLQGKYQEALENYKEALKIYEKIGDEIAAATLLNNIGNIYISTGKFDDALIYINEALEKARKLNNENNIATYLNNIGSVYQDRGNYKEALKHFEDALEILKKINDKKRISVLLNNIGMIYEIWGSTDEALEYYKESLKIDEQLGLKNGISTSLSNIGAIYYRKGLYTDALKNFEKALTINREIGNLEAVATSLNNLGMLYDSMGKFEEALEKYEEALKIDKELGRESSIPTVLMNMGMVYHSWGKYDDALKYFEESLQINKKLRIEDGVASSLYKIGLVYESWGRYDDALKYFQTAMEKYKEIEAANGIATSLLGIGVVFERRGNYEEALKYYEDGLTNYKKIGDKDGIASSLYNIASIYIELGEYDKALKNFQESLNINRELGAQISIASSLNGIGIIYKYKGMYEEALEVFFESLKILLKSGVELSIATSLNNIGDLMYAAGIYDLAARYFNNSIKWKERIRKTAPGGIRRDFLEYQLVTYKSLVSTYSKRNLTDSLLYAFELGKSKYLFEELSKNSSDFNIDINELVNLTNNNNCFLVFTNSDWFEKIQVIIKDNNISVREFNDSLFLSNVKNLLSPEDNKVLASLRGAKISKVNDIDIPSANYNESEFGNIIKYYHSLLMNPLGNVTKIKKIGSELYKFLIEPVEYELKGKKELIIIPDGILSLLPFETLIDNDGKYLTENFNIKYNYSLNVFKLLKQRDYLNNSNEMLAFGGAVYNGNTVDSKSPGVENNAQLTYLDNKVNESLTGKRSTGFAYDQLGYGSWNNLPGTEQEVEAINMIIEGAKVLKGIEVTEEKIKELSRSGELKKYKVLHFATHGITVPEIPELSAIVLSQFNDEREEDGYLTMKEIAELDIEADFVNLSACETGLGKIYSGEGVVGLTQSFLIAGANGLSVSLWQVADKSTALFMTEMYKMVESTALDYPQAMTEVKKGFINGEYGEKYKHPFYWAPFVYYGK